MSLSNEMRKYVVDINKKKQWNVGTQKPSATLIRNRGLPHVYLYNGIKMTLIPNYLTLAFIINFRGKFVIAECKDEF